MTGANGSQGDVISRNNHLVTYDLSDGDQVRYKCAEKIAAVSNKQETGYWLLTNFIDKFYAFEVTAAGVNIIPVVSQTTPVVPLSGYRRNAIGTLKVAANGAKVAIAHNQKGLAPGAQALNGSVVVFDFNAATGIVSIR